MDRLTAARVFIDVAGTESFTATAERLEMSRPMVTRYVETMESWLKVRLLQRTTRKVSLTSAGERCLPDIRTWVEHAQDLQHQTMTEQEPAGKIRIATSVSFGFAQLVPALKSYLSENPKVEIDIDLEDRAVDLIEERIDLAIRIASDPNPNLIGRPIARCESALVASPDYLARSSPVLEPSDLRKHLCLGYNNFERHVWHLSRGEEHQSVEVTCRLSSNEVTTLLNAAIQGMGISLQPTYLAHAVIERGDLSLVLPEWQPKTMEIYALYPSRKYLSPAVRRLIDHLLHYFSSSQWRSIPPGPL